MPFILCGLLLLLSWQSVEAVEPSPALSKARHDLASMPLLFEINLGQVDEQVRFLARPEPGVAYFFTERGHTVLLSEVRGSPHGPDPLPALGPATESPFKEDSKSPPPGRSHALRVEFVGANTHPSISAEGEAQGLTHYFLGRDPGRWRTQVPSYPILRYSDLYDGIDLIYYGTGARLEYDFIVHPGADPSRIRVRYTGADGPLALAPDGAAEVVTGVGSILEGQPCAYESASSDPSSRRQVCAEWELAGQNELVFNLGEYDAARELHIDPLLFSTFVGGAGNENGASIAVDAAGGVYITGQTPSTNFPTVTGSFDTSYNIGTGPNDVFDAFVLKLDRSASTLVYSTYLGGSGNDSGSKVVVDSQGNAFVMGSTASSDFPVTTGAYDESYNLGASDAFVAKLDPTGATLLYSTFIGGTGDEPGPYVQGLAIDNAGNAYVAGTTTSTDFPITVGAYQQTLGGARDAFVAKLNPTGTALLYNTYLGGSDDELGSGLAVDNQNNAYVIGETNSSDFPTTIGAYAVTLGGDYDSFVSKLDPAGSALVYSTYLGGTGTDLTSGIALDSSQNAYITGDTLSHDFPTTPATFQTTHGGAQDSFVTKLSASGSMLLYSTFLGGSGDEYSGQGGLAVNAAGEVFIAAATSSHNFQTTAGAYQVTDNGGDYDGVVVKLNAAGSSLLYSTYLGGSGFDTANGCALDPSGDVWIVGRTGSPFPTTPGAFDTTFNGWADAFVSKLGIPRPGQIVGTVFIDVNGDGVLDSVTDIGLSNWFIRLDPGPIFTKTDLAGHYEFFAQPGTYTIGEVSESNWSQTYPRTVEYNVTVGEGQTAAENDFGNHASASVQDLSIDIVSLHPYPYRSACCDPPIPYLYNVTYQNVGTTSFGTQICVTLPPEVTYQPPATVKVPSDFTSSTPTQSGSTLCWTIKSGGLPPNAFGTMLIKVVPDHCPLNSQPELMACAFIGPEQGDKHPENNRRWWDHWAHCSHDPNDLEVTPKGCGVEGFITAEDSLTYLIRFQNTGTGPAHLVVVRDTLDQDCDLSTLEILGSSHPSLFEVNGRELKWTFWDIVLPESASDEPGSHGYVKFKVKPRSDVQLGAVIENRAGIYFDLNEVVLTNSTVNTITNAPLPVSAMAAPPETLPVGTPVGFTYTGGTSAATFLWTFGPGATPASSTDENPTGVTYSTPGLKNVVLVVKLGDCEAEPAVQSISLFHATGQIPGDCNQDGNLDLSDAVWLLGHLFLGTFPRLPCEGGTSSSPGPGDLALVDVNGDGGIDVSDAVSILGFLYVGSKPPFLGTRCVPILGCPASTTNCGP